MINRSEFVRCKADNNAFADCEIYRRGDLLRFVGYSTMDFTREDALRLAEIIHVLYGEDSRVLPDRVAVEKDNILRTVIGRLKEIADTWTNDDNTLEGIGIIRDTVLISALFLERLYGDLERTISDGR